MQYVPLALAQELWNATPERNWSALFDRLQEHLEKEPELEGVHATTLLQSTRTLAHMGIPYPLSPEELSRVLNEHLRDRTS